MEVDWIYGLILLYQTYASFQSCVLITSCDALFFCFTIFVRQLLIQLEKSSELLLVSGGDNTNLLSAPVIILNKDKMFDSGGAKKQYNEIKWRSDNIPAVGMCRDNSNEISKEMIFWIRQHKSTIR